jgi:hypothetical protein
VTESEVTAAAWCRRAGRDHRTTSEYRQRDPASRGGARRCTLLQALTAAPRH